MARSFAWMALGGGLSKVLSAAALFIVLDVLTDAEMGQASIALAAFSILGSITELGLGVALVQAAKLERDVTDGLFWLGLGLSVLVYFGIFAAAPWVEAAYESPGLSALFRTEGLAVIFGSLALVPRNLLTRELKFKELAAVDNLALLGSSGVMIGLAYGGYGPWALIGAEVTNRAGQALLCAAFRPYRPRLRLPWQRVRPLVEFGLYATGSRLLYNFYMHADYLIVGKYFGEAQVGVYFVAFRVVAEPVQTLAHIVNQVAYSAFARLQNDLERLRKYFFSIARVNVTFIGTILVFVAVWFDTLLLALGYDQWRAAVPYVQVFALFGLVRSVGPLVPQVLNAKGLARLNFIFSLVGSFLMPLSFVVGAQWGPMGVAWSWATVYPIFTGLMFWFGSRALEMPFAEFMWKCLGSGLLIVLPVAVASVALQPTIETLPPVAALAVGALTTLGLGVAAGVLRERETLRSVLRRSSSVPTPAGESA